MEKDLIFFGESGLTSTSAGHVANLAKEYIALIDSIFLMKEKSGLNPETYLL